MSGQRHRILLCPEVSLLRVTGDCFDLNKSFPLPELASLMIAWRKKAAEAPPPNVLLVGHTDTSGDDPLNDKLSFERAESIQALLQGNANVWLSRYATTAASSGLWGSQEDQLMLQSVHAKGSFETNGIAVVGEVGEGGGYMTARDRKPIKIGERDTETDHATTIGATGQVHFKLGSALLTPEGKAVVGSPSCMDKNRRSEFPCNAHTLSSPGT